MRAKTTLPLLARVGTLRVPAGFPVTAALLIAGCGPTPPQITPLPAEFKQIAATPSVGAALTSTTVEVGAEVERVGLSEKGNLVVRTATATFEFVGGALEKRALYAPAGEQTSLGAVSSISPRIGGGAWLSAAHGLFALEGLYVTRSPLAVGAVAVTVDQPRGPLAGLWLGTDDGLVRRRADATQRFTLAGVAPNVTQLALEPNGKAAIAVMDGRVFVFLPDGDGVASTRPPALAGAPRAVAAANDLLFAATDTGLWRYAVADAAWSRVMLAAAADPKKIEALAADPVTGTLWGRAQGELVRLENDAATAHTLSAGMRPFTVDQLGDVWVPNGAQLLRLKASSAMPVSFAKDLKPWLQMHCTTCHADYAEPTPFAAKAETALFRVGSGDMPRCTGGVPCPSGMRLNDTTLLEQWIRTGKQP